MAFRRAGKIGDGFMFAGDFERCNEGRTRVEQYLKENGRSPDSFGLELIALRGRTPAEAADAMKRWEDQGGTHACVVTMNCGLTNLQEHLDFIAETRDLLA